VVKGVPCDGVIVNVIEDRGVYELWGVRWKECLCEGVIVNVKTHRGVDDLGDR
jgi:hypothetical protein